MKSAIQYFKEALNLCEGPDCKGEASDIHNELAHLSIVTEDYRSAVKHCSTSIELFPNNPKVTVYWEPAILVMLRTSKHLHGDIHK